MIIDLHVRLPKDLLEQLRALAARDHRSLNGQIVALLERAARPAPPRGGHDR